MAPSYPRGHLPRSARRERIDRAGARGRLTARDWSGARSGGPVFGLRRRREAAAAEAARDAERRDLFAELAQRPEHICPFLGLAYERTGYVEGPSIEHRCFAFGDPARLSSEQQTHVCQERGYGQCPRYLRGLLVTPTEELQALRNPQAAMAPLPPAPRAGPVAEPRRRRRGALAAVALLVLLLVGAGAGYLLLTRSGGVAVDATQSSAPSATAVVPSEAPTATVEPSPEPTPSAGDTFAFYEVSVGPGSYLLYEVDAGGAVESGRRASFTDFSFARVEPIEGTDGELYWQTADGGLAGLAYRYPDSGDFRIRAVFVDDRGSRRSVFLEDEDLTRIPEATPAP